ncbi:HAD-IIIC family phosphatase [Herbivorax sp. ANBcel31]|uniref:HAD-IIIC family phosphatase n=1 Tax=Herbivorax sp. ANBcel31 TaxID=3069754 RepID=UPI0027B52AA1|nr:HAD-IIIC family phosphatase [Herbivorax sp. ANBcel31]MDQ2086504.1 HAD-IIIC family phosphatase [Herbivorax sp. ANBcel31]
MKIKCLVWDLDDTLWEGTLREDRDVVFDKVKKSIIKKIDERGILQSIASRNDLQQAQEKLKELEILEYFFYPQCHWGSKVESIKLIANKLNIALDSIGYIDDNPFELFEVQYFLPEVKTYKSEEYEELLNLEEFKSDFSTKESKMRRQMMKSREMRERAESFHNGSKEDFLKACKMELILRSANTNDIYRIYELASRTNQMNNMLDRISKEVIVDFIDSKDKAIYVAELSDRFGYHGIIGVCLFEMKDKISFIKLFCISCRIEGRGIGAAFLKEAISLMSKKHSQIEEVYCEYLDEKKNRPALMLLQITGFKFFKKNEKKSTFNLKLPVEESSLNWLKVIFML